MAPGTEGGVTVKLPQGEPMSIFDAAMAYAQEGTPLLIIGGKEYGTGSSRDWAAKGTKLLGVRAVLVESFERIHRSNLVGMGVLPLQFLPGENAESHGLDGTEVYSITGLAPLNNGVTVPKVNVHVTRQNGESFNFAVRLRIDTPTEAEYYRHGGVLNFVLRQLAAS
jgi:aconitate hydratase